MFLFPSLNGSAGPVGVRYALLSAPGSFLAASWLPGLLLPVPMLSLQFLTFLFARFILPIPFVPLLLAFLLPGSNFRSFGSSSSLCDLAFFFIPISTAFFLPVCRFLFARRFPLPGVRLSASRTLTFTSPDLALASMRSRSTLRNPHGRTRPTSPVLIWPPDTFGKKSSMALLAFV